MNNWHNEFMAEYHRQQILEEAEHIRLEKLVLNTRLYRPGAFERSMFRFANWMISTGKRLRRRYEIPSMDCGKSPSRSFAR
ncbi:MAG TPA: hypothetical protein VJ821_01015 [Anaerolineales bacterium]|nr:hypothetical protein [Anaerolineales bacterium]